MAQPLRHQRAGSHESRAADGREEDLAQLKALVGDLPMRMALSHEAVSRLRASTSGGSAQLQVDPTMRYETGVDGGTGVGFGTWILLRSTTSSSLALAKRSSSQLLFTGITASEGWKIRSKPFATVGRMG